MQPTLSSKELSLFQFAAEKKKYALEFGTGGSTFLLVKLGVNRIISVESDPTWIQRIVEHEELAPHIMSGRLTIHHGDVGPTGKWGYPVDKSRLASSPNYW